MNETYCGKSCQTCTYRADTGCRGCREEASRECKLARCCREKGHESCESCVFSAQCGMYQGKDTAPQFRLAKKKAELEHQEFLKRRGAFLAKWIWILFWLFIPANVAEVMVQWIPALEGVGHVLGAASVLAYGAILWKISSEEVGYRRAGVLTLVDAALGLSLLWSGDIHVFVMLLLTIVSAVVSLLASYYEYNAHADVLEGVDNELSQQWRTLWKWMMGASIALVVGALLVLVIIGLLVVFVAAVAMCIIGVLKLVYLYRMARIFQDVAAG